jgi:hypothetical protein
MSGVRAPDVERHLIDSLIVLTDDTELMQAVVDELDELIDADLPPPVDTEAIRAKIRRVARLYEDGLKSEIDYQREIAALRAQLEAPIPIRDLPDAAQALDLLGDLPGILKVAETADRRALLQSLFTSITLEPHLATKAKARDEYRELLSRLDERVECTDWWAGWVSGRPFKHTPSDPDVRGAASKSRAGKRLWITNTLSGYSCTHSHLQTPAFL